MENTMEKTGKHFEDLIKIMNILRSKKGCPWDRKQNHTSIKYCLVDEACEVLEAIDHKNPSKLEEELGDLLYQIIFHARIAEERGSFNINNVITGIEKKLIDRHPHVFGSKKIKSSNMVLQHWHKRKLLEQKKKGNKSVVNNLPHTLSALYKAAKLQKKVAVVGFEWTQTKDILNKIEEEFEELKTSIKKKSKRYIQEELGDLLFSIVVLSRHLTIDPEHALTLTINKFIYRFKKMEQILKKQGINIEDASLSQMESVWKKCKKTRTQNYK